MAMILGRTREIKAECHQCIQAKKHNAPGDSTVALSLLLPQTFWLVYVGTVYFCLQPSLVILDQSSGQLTEPGG